MSVALESALTRSTDASWQSRRAAAVDLGRLLPDAAAFERLVAMIDDAEDTSVGRQAASELARHGGTEGLAAVVRAYATLDDDIGYHLSGALGALWHQHRFPLPERLGALRASDDPDVARGAEELAADLGTG